MVGRAVLLLVAVSAMACAAPATEEDGAATGSAIVGGIPTSDFPGIGYFQAIGKTPTGERSSGSFCTGTLIAPDVVLTAAHCLDDLEESFDAGTTYDRLEFAIGASDRAADTRVSVAAKTVKLHPGYKVTGGTDDTTHDIGYVVLREPITIAQPLRVKRTMHAASCSYVATGYGVSLNGFAHKATHVDAESNGIRRALVTCASAGYDDAMIVTHTSAGSQCNGDSGGPLRIRQTDEIVGVVSYSGASTCTANTRTYYTPVATHLDFVDEALALSRSKTP